MLLYIFKLINIVWFYYDVSLILPRFETDYICVFCVVGFKDRLFNFYRVSRISFHTMGDKTWQEAASLALSPALMISNNS